MTTIIPTGDRTVKMRRRTTAPDGTVHERGDVVTAPASVALRWVQQARAELASPTVAATATTKNTRRGTGRVRKKAAPAPEVADDGDTADNAG